MTDLTDDLMADLELVLKHDVRQAPVSLVTQGGAGVPLLQVEQEEVKG